ncbi:hypothetical protein ANANG_G00151530 [Anguilla anguilla]|uniref:Ras-related GTP-binding protein n=2 Tax=Anguilla anguilla TaxID=7936 RepID=A0A9D3RU27_ANGAN|nr:hypothetical protein ANANG_G00151530 [Anguilla anguilla]
MSSAPQKVWGLKALLGQVNKTLHRLHRQFYLGWCRRDVESYCRCCNAGTAMQVVPMERLAVDILGPFLITAVGIRVHNENKDGTHTHITTKREIYKQRDCAGDSSWVKEKAGSAADWPSEAMSSIAMKKKVLLMGKSGSGKTSMRSIIFANYIARDTRRLGATIDVEHSHVRFLGNLVLNLWDCGGQDTFMENYFTSQRDNIFRNVEVLIYVFDVESRELEKDMHYYQSCLEAILQNSPDAKVFCLVHKMDLVQEDQRDLIFKEREEDLKRLSRPLACTCFRTSIWDETLYKAWSSIVYQLIPNVQQLETNLRNFAQIIEADEVLLFERATFLVISHYQCKEQRDAHRFEKISNIIKQFKLSCSKLAASFQSMEVRNSNFAAFIDVFTSNTYVMVIMSDPTIPSAATLINIRNARKHFEKLERVDGPKHSLHMRMR